MSGCVGESECEEGRKERRKVALPRCLPADGATADRHIDRQLELVPQEPLRERDLISMTPPPTT